MCREKHHESELLNLFCEQCKVCICDKCGQTRHSHHTKVDIEQAAKECKVNIEEIAEEMKKEVANFQLQVQRSKERTRKSREEIVAARNKALTSLEELMRVLKEYEITTMSKLDVIEQSRLSQSPFLWESRLAENGLFSPAARHFLSTRFQVGGVSGGVAAMISNQKPSYNLTSFSWKLDLPLDHGVKMNVQEAINFGLNKLNFEDIRENQRKVVEAYLSGRDVLMFSPTGSGKSLTFHIAPFAIDFFKHGERDDIQTVCLVIFPLVSLMNDQVSSLREKGIKAVVVGPDSSETENKEASEGKCNLVFTSPEALFGSHRSTFLTLKNKIEAVFIDVVHCVAKWLVFYSFHLYNVIELSVILVFVQLRFFCLKFPLLSSPGFLADISHIHVKAGFHMIADRRSQIAISLRSSAIIWKHTSAIVCDPAIAIADDRRR